MRVSATSRCRRNRGCHPVALDQKEGKETKLQGKCRLQNLKKSARLKYKKELFLCLLSRVRVFLQPHMTDALGASGKDPSWPRPQGAP